MTDLGGTPPIITGLNPDEGAVGKSFQIDGTELGNPTKVDFIDKKSARTSAIILTSGPKQITARVPNVIPGDYNVEVTTSNPTPSNTKEFTVTPE